MELRVPWREPFQGASQCLPDPNDSAEQHINFARFDSLNIADVQIGEFGELLLSHIPRHAFATNVVS